MALFGSLFALGGLFLVGRRRKNENNDEISRFHVDTRNLKPGLSGPGFI